MLFFFVVRGPTFLGKLPGLQILGMFCLSFRALDVLVREQLLRALARRGHPGGGLEAFPPLISSLAVHVIALEKADCAWRWMSEAHEE